jgi:hypothetical protein
MSQSNNYVFDLTSAINLQSAYLNDLSGYILNNPTNANDAAAHFVEIETKLNNLKTAIDSGSYNSQYIIDHQKDMLDIVNNENNRLADKRSIIDDKLSGTKRMIELNDNYRKRQNEFNNIFIVIIISIIIFIVLKILQRTFLFIPQPIFDILIILLFSITIIYIGKILYVIYLRDLLNFDRKQLPPPRDVSSSNNNVSNNNNDNIYDILGDLTSCTGQSCCTNGTTWDEGVYKCIIEPTEANKVIDLTSSNKTNATYISSGNCTSDNTKKVCGKACILKTDKCYTEGFEVLPKFSLYE